MNVREMNLNDTIEMMKSEDYRERFKAEYYQVAIRLQKLNNMVKAWDDGRLNFAPTCPRDTYDKQIAAMEDYVTILRVRAELEGITI